MGPEPVEIAACPWGARGHGGRTPRRMPQEAGQFPRRPQKVIKESGPEAGRPPGLAPYQAEEVECSPPPTLLPPPQI